MRSGTSAVLSTSTSTALDPTSQSHPFPRRNNILVMSICAAVIALFGYQVFLGTNNFDIWYLIATGREIVENGIPYDNVFAMIPDAKIVVQQWLLCVLYFALYELAGFGGIALCVTLVFFATMAVLYRIMRLRRRDTFGGEWILLFLLLVMLVMQPMIKMVSTPFSILILAVLVLLLELYRRDGRYLYLSLIVPLIVLHMQVHMSFIVFDLGIIVFYLIPNFVGRLKTSVGFLDADYKHLPLLLLLVVALLATLVNPYGIDGALYLLNSYGAASYGNVIPELRPQMPFAYGISGVCAVAVTCLSAIAIGKGGLRRIDLPGVLIFLGCTYLGFSNLRSLWMLGLPLVLLGGDMMRGWYIPGIAELLQTARGTGDATTSKTSIFSSKRFAYPEWVIFLCSVICTAGVGVFAMLIVLNFTAIDDGARNERYTPQSLLNAITRDAEKADGASAAADELRIFNPTVLGGYMEWQGFPVYNDSRVEVWNSAISGLDRDLHNEYVDMTLGGWTSEQFDQFVAENGFDYLIAETNSPLHSYLAQNPEFQNILGTQYYELYKRL